MKRLMIFFMFLFAGTIGLLAQELPVPEDWADLYNNYGVFFGTYLGIAGLTTFLSEYVVRLLRLSTKFLKVLFVCIIAVGLSFIGMWLSIGYLAEALWWETLLWGGLSAATAAGLRSGNLLFAKTVVDFLIGLIKMKEPAG